MRANVYVDGFNLYYLSVKGTPYRWLDLAALCRLALRPDCPINRIRYFTAQVKDTPDDPDKAQRQQTYLRALRTIPNLSVHFGHFLSHPHEMRLVNPPPGGPDRVMVWRTEEKGSDVNLATWLLVDACEDDFDVALVVSNDTDLVTPIRVVREKYRRTIGVLTPGSGGTARALREVASFNKIIRESWLKISQFSPVLTDARGPFHKPTVW